MRDKVFSNPLNVTNDHTETKGSGTTEVGENDSKSKWSEAASKEEGDNKSAVLNGETVSIVSTSASTSSEYSELFICPEVAVSKAPRKVDVPTVMRLGETEEDNENQVAKMAQLSEAEKLKLMTNACKTILTCIGEDPSREGLLRTPQRWAKALLFLTHGYEKNLHDVTNEAVFEENHNEMVLVRDIDIHSLCEHHMLPFTGRVHVAYIPNGKIVGLSKIARIAEVFARRLQVQERLTSQIADAIVEAVNPLGVGVVIECTHFCMVMRGVQKSGASTVTSCVRGCFESNPKTRAEFFSIINRSSSFRMF